MTKSNKSNEKTNFEYNQPAAPTLNANFITQVKCFPKIFPTPHTLSNTHSSLLFDVNKKLKDFLSR